MHPVSAFIKAVFCGAIAGTLIPATYFCIGAYVVGDLRFDAFEIFQQTIVYFFVPCLLIVLFCSLVLGLPTSTILRELGYESRRNYALIGGVLGLGVAVVLPLPLGGSLKIGSEEFFFFGSLAALSGAVTGWVWGTERHKRKSDPTPF